MCIQHSQKYSAICLGMSERNEYDSQSIPDGTALAEDLLARCKTLLSELEAFRNFVDERRTEQEPVVDTRKFQTSVGTELKSLQRVLHTFCSLRVQC